MRRTVLAAVAAVTLAGLAACAGSPAAPVVNVPPASSAPAVPTTTAPPGPVLNERGNIVKQIGETGGWGGQTVDTLTVKFVVDKITVDPKCTSQYASRPDNGHFLQVDVRVETTPQMTAAHGAMAMNAGFFSTIGADGITESNLMTGASFSCLDRKAELPQTFTPASKYRGSIVLDTANPSGILVFRPPFIDDGGWEWTYGAPA